MDYIKKNKEKLAALKATLNQEELRKAVHEFTRPSDIPYDPSLPETEQQKAQRLQLSYTLERDNASSYERTKTAAGDREFSINDLTHELAWKQLAAEQGIEIDDTESNQPTNAEELALVLGGAPSFAEFKKTLAKEAMATLAYNTIYEGLQHMSASSWVPTAVATTAVTGAALRQIWAAWQGNSGPKEPITMQKLVDQHEWENAAAKTLVNAADKIDQLVEEKDGLAKQLKDLKEMRQEHPDSDDLVKAISETKAGLANLAGRLKGMEHIPKVKLALDHISLIQKLSSGKLPADFKFETTPAPEEIITSFQDNGRGFNNLAQPIFYAEEGKVPAGDPMDYEFTTPTRPSADRFLDVKPPFEYDGTPANWKPWRTAVETYIADNRARFRSAIAVIDVISAATKAGTRAKSIMTALMGNIFMDGTVEKAEFEQCTKPFQVFLWTMGKLEPYFVNGVATADALKVLRHQQRNESIVHWMQKLDEARMTLGMTYTTLLPFVLTGIDKNLAAYISTKVNKTTMMLTWDDLLMWGATSEEELRTLHPAHYLKQGSHGNTTESRPARGHAGTVTTGTRAKLSEEDFHLVRTGNGCFKCFWPGHRKENCTREVAMSLNDDLRKRLREAASRRRPATGRAGQTFVPASNNPYGHAMSTSTGNSGANTPATTTAPSVN